MDENLEAQEPDTNLTATLWQPYGNLMIGLGKILRSEDIKSILNIQDIHLAETKNNAYLCNGLSLTFFKGCSACWRIQAVCCKTSNETMFALALFSEGLDSRHRF